jgi:hypothetical protein
LEYWNLSINVNFKIQNLEFTVSLSSISGLSILSHLVLLFGNQCKLRCENETTKSAWGNFKGSKLAAGRGDFLIGYCILSGNPFD